MQIEMQYGENHTSLEHDKWDVAFVGNAIDMRGKESINYLKENTVTCNLFVYEKGEFIISVNGSPFYKDDIDSELSHLINVDSKVVLDSTTLTFPEILIVSQFLKNRCLVSISILYIEPADYKKKRKPDLILHKRDFELSEEVYGYEAIPGHALSLTNDIDQKLVYLCGFESERIDRAMEDSQSMGANCYCLFGVPAMSPGWEMDSFDNNLSVIKERKMTGGISFCGATNPQSVFKQLEKIYEGLGDEDQLFVIPLGTKPMSIGATMFLLSKPKDRVAVLYDHPLELEERALKIANWHLYNINLESL